MIKVADEIEQIYRCCSPRKEMESCRIVSVLKENSHRNGCIIKTDGTGSCYMLEDPLSRLD